MLTREEAKKAKCPYRSFQDAAFHGGFTIVGDIADEKKELIKESILSLFCKAEACPKWIDENVYDMPCKKICKETTELYCAYLKEPYNIQQRLDLIKSCNNCDKHFGRCGG